MAAFTPALGTTTFLAAARTAVDVEEACLPRIHFTYTPARDRTSEAGARTVPEVWTNLPGDAPAEDGHDPVAERWHAIQLLPLPLPGNGDSSLHTASVPIPDQQGDYEYTYRRRDLVSGRVEWLGSADGNGKIRVVSGAPDGVAASAWAGPDLARGHGGGTWQTFQEGAHAATAAAVGTFRLDEREAGVQTFALGAEVVPPEWRKAGAVEGLVWEQSKCAPLRPFEYL